jgi:hypothetical protein
MMAMHTVIFRRWLLDVFSDIETEVSSWEGVSTSIHKYGGMQFNYLNKELGHVHSNGVTDVRLNRKIKEGVILSSLAEDHHTFINSGWVSLHIRNAADGEKALELFLISYDFHRRRLMRAGRPA